MGNFIRRAQLAFAGYFSGRVVDCARKHLSHQTDLAWILLADVFWAVFDGDVYLYLFDFKGALRGGNDRCLP